MLYRSYYQAHMVESALEHLLACDEANGHPSRLITSEPWINGRERGFRFSTDRMADGTHIYPRFGADAPKTYTNGDDRTFHAGGFVTSVYVAEDRNTDAIAVQPSDCSEYTDITDEEYKRDRLFVPHADFFTAARLVLALLGTPVSADGYALIAAEVHPHAY